MCSCRNLRCLWVQFACCCMNFLYQILCVLYEDYLFDMIVHFIILLFFFFLLLLFCHTENFIFFLLLLPLLLNWVVFRKQKKTEWINENENKQQRQLRERWVVIFLVKCSGEMGCEKRKHKRHNKMREREKKNALNIYAWFLLHEYVKEWQWRENES